MRVWDIPVSCLCNKHLLAQHNEIHAIYSIITNNKTGFAKHPEVMRWRGHIDALVIKHVYTTEEMIARRMNANSPLGAILDFNTEWPEPWQPVAEQLKILRGKANIIHGCDCYKKYTERR